QVHADSLSQIWSRANAEYFRGDYRTAADDYERLVQAGVIDPDVTYNLALTEARLGRYGSGIPPLARPPCPPPGDEDAQGGLDAVRSALGRRRAESHGEAEVDAGPPIGEALFGSVSADTLAVVSLGLELAFFGILAGLLFARRESARLALGVA